MRGTGKRKSEMPVERIERDEAEVEGGCGRDRCCGIGGDRRGRQ